MLTSFGCIIIIGVVPDLLMAGYFMFLAWDYGMLAVSLCPAFGCVHYIKQVAPGHVMNGGCNLICQAN